MKEMDFEPITSYPLLPCPFCGGDPIMQHITWDGIHHYNIICPFCSTIQGQHDTAKQAAENWNKRNNK